MSPTEAFEAALAARDARDKAWRDEEVNLNADCKAEMHAAWRKAFPRRRKEPGYSAMIAECQDCHEIYGRYGAKARGISESRKGVAEADGERIAGLSQNVEPPKTDEPILWRSTNSIFYNSQGFGACKYAKDHAQRDVDHAEANGLHAELRTVDNDAGKPPRHAAPGTGGWVCPNVDYQAWVWTTPTGLKALELKPGLSLRDVVRLSWKRGVNPRVAMPFLPSGYEESVGLDYFGGELKRGNG